MKISIPLNNTMPIVKLFYRDGQLIGKIDYYDDGKLKYSVVDGLLSRQDLAELKAAPDDAVKIVEVLRRYVSAPAPYIIYYSDSDFRRQYSSVP